MIEFARTDCSLSRYNGKCVNVRWLFPPQFWPTRFTQMLFHAVAEAAAEAAAYFANTNFEWILRKRKSG